MFGEPVIRFLFLLVAIGSITHAATAQDSKFPSGLKRSVRAGHALDEKAKGSGHLATVSDDELQEFLSDILKLPDFRSRSGYDSCLSEIVRRGGAKWQGFLKGKFDALMKSNFNLYDDAEDLVPGSTFNLELLTALRRVQKQPDPLRVYIDGPEELTGTALSLPNLSVRIKNVDVAKADIGFTSGGDYRSGRQMRWRIVVHDEKGKVIPVRTHLGSSVGGVYAENGGGLSTELVLQHKESWETSLSVRSFIEVPDPGKYKLTVVYHNTQTIAGESNVDGLILSQSRPVLFTLKPIVITHSQEEREAVRKLVSELDEKKKLKIVAGTYGEWAHKLIAPDSPGGKLLTMGLPAVPTIIESLHSETITKEKRAWLFGILFSLTGENDPRQSSVLGNYENSKSGWKIWGGLTGESPSGGMSFGVKGSVYSSGTIVSKAQDALVKTWDNWLRKVKVEERDVAQDKVEQSEQQ